MRALPESAIFLEGTLTPTPTATPTATATAKASRTIVLISLIVCAARFNILGFAVAAFFWHIRRESSVDVDCDSDCDALLLPTFITHIVGIAVAFRLLLY